MRCVAAGLDIGDLSSPLLQIHKGESAHHLPNPLSLTGRATAFKSISPIFLS